MSRPTNILVKMQQDRLAYLQKQQRLQQTQKQAAQVQSDKRQLLSYPDLQLANKTIQIAEIVPDEDRDPVEEEQKLVQLLSQVMSPVYAAKIARVAAVDQQDGSAAPMLYLFVDNFHQYRGDLVAHFSTGRANISSVYTWLFRWVKQRFSDEYDFKSSGNQAAMTDTSMSINDRPQPKPVPKPRPLPVIPEQTEPDDEQREDPEADNAEQPEEQGGPPRVSVDNMIIGEWANVQFQEEYAPEIYEIALRNLTQQPDWDRVSIGAEERQARRYLLQSIIENRQLVLDDRPEYATGYFRKRTRTMTFSIVSGNISRANCDRVLKTLAAEITGSGLGRKRRAAPKPRAKPVAAPAASKKPEPHSRIVFGGGAQTTDKTLVKESQRWRVPNKPTVFLDLAMLDTEGKLAVRYSSSKRYLISPTQLTQPGVRVVTDIIGDSFDQRLFAALPVSERRVIERLLALIKVSPPDYEGGSTTDLHQQYQVLVGEISAGNNNPKLKAQLRDVVQELVALKTIPVKTGKQIIAQMCT